MGKVARKRTGHCSTSRPTFSSADCWDHRAFVALESIAKVFYIDRSAFGVVVPFLKRSFALFPNPIGSEQRALTCEANLPFYVVTT